MATDFKPTLLVTPPRSQLEQVKAAHFTPDGRDRRVEQGLRALQGPPPAFQLTPEVWKQVAESPELDDEG